jgi:hypothetical protein
MFLAFLPCIAFKCVTIPDFIHNGLAGKDNELILKLFETT